MLISTRNGASRRIRACYNLARSGELDSILSFATGGLADDRCLEQDRLGEVELSADYKMFVDQFSRIDLTFWQN